MLLLSSSYLAPVQWYTKLLTGLPVVEDRGEHFVKQTYRNRCRILGAQGVETLVVPVEHGAGASHTPMRDIRISAHEPAWQRRHWHALRTAYEGTPFFDYYADDLQPLYERPFRFLCDWNAALHEAVCRLLGIKPVANVSDTYIHPTATDTDLRLSIRPKSAPADPAFHPAPYWQLRAPGRFVPNLSIADLLFNMGPEARLVLRKSRL
ncbi:MAG: WbqC family protein [Bacteroidaceae bacterium]|nr:WbqC family protein [Bacteroidaceae bacterium]